jgi:glycosyltransferase involved in cell wall biosynthesis
MITPLILTYNEQENIERTLRRLDWAEEVVVIDSGSTDSTLEILGRFPKVRIVHRPFDNHTDQWNFGVAQCRTAWVLSLDADYCLVPELEAVLRCWTPDPSTVACYARFRYCIGGVPLRASLYPARAVLFRKDRCTYIDDGHTQLLKADGPTGFLRHPILHDDRKPLRRWLQEQIRYVERESVKLQSSHPEQLGFNDRIRSRILPGPFLVLVYLLFVRGLIFDGWRGWYYSLQRTYVELLLSLHLLELRFRHQEST